MEVKKQSVTVTDLIPIHVHTGIYIHFSCLYLHINL